MYGATKPLTSCQKLLSVRESGSLALKDLQIKREALDAFNLPVEVHKGLIGQFHINCRSFSEKFSMYGATKPLTSCQKLLSVRERHHENA
jgi:hypothetical protein